MATIAVTRTVNRYQDRLKDDRKHLADALAGGFDAAQKSLAVNLYQLPDFEFTGTTDTNTATSPVCNLTDLGIPFAAETGRFIYVESAQWNGSVGGTFLVRGLVRGHATTPVVEQTVYMTGASTGTDIGGELLTVAVQSNKVVVNAVGISGDVVTWYIKVWVGEAFPLTLV